MCNEWSMSFSKFLEDMGEKPGPEYTIDRIDANGNYTPANCKWSTPAEQNCNRRSNVVVKYLDRSMTISEWSKELAIPSPTLYSRAAKGWGAKEILFGR